MTQCTQEVLLLEDDAHTFSRHRRPGVTDHNAERLITMSVHRVSGNSIEISCERTYAPGSMRRTRYGRLKLAAQLLRLSQSDRDSIVVAGSDYGSSSVFLEYLSELGTAFVVHVRPSTKVRLAGKSGQRVTAGNLLRSCDTWQPVTVPTLGSSVQRQYDAAVLAEVELPNGRGSLFAARIGRVAGAQRSTILGLSSLDEALPEQVRFAEYSRWARPHARRNERGRRGRSQGVEPLGKAAGLQARANITLARKQDGCIVDPRSANDFQTLGIFGKNDSQVNVVELFAGAGGMGLGFLLAAHRTRACKLLYSGEANPIYVQTLRTNHNTLSETLTPPYVPHTPEKLEPADLRSREVLEHVAELARASSGVDILMGGPPCQGFSVANRNSWHAGNPSNHLVHVFLQYVEALRPKIVLMENVQGIMWTPKNGTAESVVDAVESHLQSAGYVVFPKLLDAVWYGVPQYRTRFFLMALDRDLGYKEDSFGAWGPFPAPTHGIPSRPYVTVDDAISDLPLLGNGAASSELPYPDPPARVPKRDEYLRYVRRGASMNTISDHITSRHADYVIDRYKRIPPGGNWESIREDLANYADVSRTHSNIYRRLRWEDPSITIGHYRKSMLIHPEQHRGLSLREAARLQSFPDWFRFEGTIDGGPGGLMHKQQQLANAVCPLVTRAIAEFVLEL